MPERGRAALRQLPGRPAIWLAAVALVAACLIGCSGIAIGAALTGFGDRGGHSREGGWGDERGSGDGQDGEHKRGDDEDRTPAPSPSVSPKPTATPTTPAPTPTASPTA
jgi:hypothetical protein